MFPYALPATTPLVRDISALASSPVTATDSRSQIILSNGKITLTFDKKTGQASSLLATVDGKQLELGSGRETLYFDANAEVDNPPVGVTVPKKGYFRSITSCRLVIDTPDRAEVAVLAGPGPNYPFIAEVRYTLLREQSGFYATVVYKRSAGLPAGTLYQSRFVMKTDPNGVFDHYVVDAERIAPIPKSSVAKTVADATFVLEDGSVKTKYMQSVYWGDHLTYGTTGKNVGLWAITPSPEFLNGGPIKQGQTVHDNVLLRVLQSVHFGASPLHFAKGETWEKVYGPVFFYANSGSDPKTMLADAEKQQQVQAGQWPFPWVNDPAYKRQRGGVTGLLRRSDGGDVAGTWVILTTPGTDWTKQGKGYEFWTRTDAHGRFSLAKVPADSYTLYASGADQPEDRSWKNVSVQAGKTTDLGTLFWKPLTHGKKLWQIGTFDHTAGEFRNGTDARSFQMFSRYPEQFPDDVTFTVGKSDPARDWNYAHWSFYSKTPEWKIRFALPELPKGNATLTIGFASALPLNGKTTNLQVAVNGAEIENIHLPKTGTAGYRGGIQDSQYNVRYLRFDAAKLKKGWNEITLAHRDALPFPKEGTVETGETGQGIGQVMYDALKLEVEP